MKITSVTVRVVNIADSKLLAFGSITLDDSLVIRDLKIIEGSNGKFVAMPNKKSPDGEYYDVTFPILPELRQEITNVVIGKYQQLVGEQEDNSDLPFK